jgi:hypothetical protein
MLPNTDNLFFSKWLMIYDLNVILRYYVVVILTFQYVFFFFQYSHFYMTCRKLLTSYYYRTTPEAQKAYESAVNHSTAWGCLVQLFSDQLF